MTTLRPSNGYLSLGSIPAVTTVVSVTSHLAFLLFQSKQSLASIFLVLFHQKAEMNCASRQVPIRHNDANIHGNDEDIIGPPPCHVKICLEPGAVALRCTDDTAKCSQPKLTPVFRLVRGRFFICHILHAKLSEAMFGINHLILGVPTFDPYPNGGLWVIDQLAVAVHWFVRIW